ncbi:hypothetical protein Nepgr_015868 [Nepenthes gracilis]|uniref:Uncharacterized protein n=1 Tax=Nepenthes gracilis TaxID=150966 RepID=A0AAD3SP08_NEPGR|nr:hypothetical protein Nepgr_015868 [Nepenthes gracilis]
MLTELPTDSLYVWMLSPMNISAFVGLALFCCLAGPRVSPSLIGISFVEIDAECCLQPPFAPRRWKTRVLLVAGIRFDVAVQYVADLAIGSDDWLGTVSVNYKWSALLGLLWRDDAAAAVPRLDRGYCSSVEVPSQGALVIRFSLPVSAAALFGADDPVDLCGLGTLKVLAMVSAVADERWNVVDALLAEMMLSALGKLTDIDAFLFGMSSLPMMASRKWFEGVLCRQCKIPSLEGASRNQSARAPEPYPKPLRIPSTGATVARRMPKSTVWHHIPVYADRGHDPAKPPQYPHLAHRNRVQRAHQPRPHKDRAKQHWLTNQPASAASEQNPQPRSRGSRATRTCIS